MKKKLNMASQATLRIAGEVTQIQRGSDLSLAVAYQDHDIRNVKALIIGPPDTPYEFGFFEFNVKFKKEYPANPPDVLALTTNGGRCRFNPNIYAGGKVCLSILGTWRGEPGEQWSSAQGLESILISIQSLMSSNPYENEPGFENAKSTSDKKNMASYVSKIRHESLRIAVIQKLEDYFGIHADGTVDPPLPTWEDDSDMEDEDDKMELDEEKLSFDPFKDLCKRRFLWYYESYVNAIANVETAEKECKVKDGQKFERMPFEGSGNTMDGVYHYPELKRRLATIKETILQETDRWTSEGLAAKKKEAGNAATIQRQFDQVVDTYKNKKNFTCDISLEDGNPFVWQLTYFGRPMTQLDGGIFRIKIAISPRFPEEQPRVTVLTKIFHHRVSKDGVLCYFVRKSEDMRSHIETILEALEEESPPYDPRTLVNQEAAKLYWGTPDEKKQYNRQLRRSVQRSMDE